jgi:hypothetical protein
VNNKYCEGIAEEYEELGVDDEWSSYGQENDLKQNDFWE